MKSDENHSKGSEFEDYIYCKLDRTITAKRVKEGAFSFPDIICASTRGSETFEFAVECKYRSSMEGDIKILDSKKQLEKYQKYHREQRIIFIALGLGGEPSRPEKVYIVPLMYIRGLFINTKQLALFEHWNMSKYIKFYHNARSLR